MKALRYGILLIAIFLAGCVAVPPGSPIIREQARSMVPPEGWGAVYVFRPALPPGDTLWEVNLDGGHFGMLAPKSYLYGVLRPGPHRLDLGYPKSAVEFEAKAGRNEYFKIAPGFPGMRLTRIDAGEAEKLVKAYTLSAFNIFENDETRRLLRGGR